MIAFKENNFLTCSGQDEYQPMNPEAHTGIDAVRITENTNSSDTIPAHDVETLNDMHLPSKYDNVIILRAQRSEVRLLILSQQCVYSFAPMHADRHGYLELNASPLDIPEAPARLYYTPSLEIIQLYFLLIMQSGGSRNEENVSG